jgi:hypothetical protein
MSAAVIADRASLKLKVSTFFARAREDIFNLQKQKLGSEAGLCIPRKCKSSLNTRRMNLYPEGK